MRALITGASAGIGSAFADRLAKDGYDLILVARRKGRLADLAKRLEKEHGTSVNVEPTDLGSPRELRLLADGIAAGPAIDLVVNNAGFGAYMPFANLPMERAEELVRVQVLAPMLLARAALPAMVAAGRGAIINIASLLAFSGFSASPMLPPRATYSATKSFLVTFSQLLAEELKDTGVRVMVVCPGFVKTEFHPIQGMDISNLPFVATPDVIVQATMAGLTAGELFCFPTIADTAALDHLKAAELELLGGGRSGDLAPRYATGSSTAEQSARE
jgi:uncharacterized protein